MEPAHAPADFIVQTSELTKVYGNFTALDRCTLHVEAGEVFGLLGPNGAGKTTLIRLLLGYLKPTQGWAKVNGLDCQSQSVEVRKILSYLPAEAAMFPHMRGKEVLQFFADVRPGGSIKRSLEFAERLELDFSRRVNFMSTGMRQKLALAATLAADTSVYILDEPTANLDPNVRSTVLAMVAEARNRGSTVIFSSHVLSEVEEVCDRVVIVRKGELVCTQVMSQLRMQHRILCKLDGPLPSDALRAMPGVRIVRQNHGEVIFETPGELQPLLGWLATLPLAEVRIEPVGLRAIYDRYHNTQPGAVSLEEPAAELSLEGTL